MSFYDRIKERINTEITTPGQGGEKADASEGRHKLAGASKIDIDRIESDPQHREQFDEVELQQLAESIAEHGQLQPIRVRWDEERGKYIIIAGERRWRACYRADVATIDCIIEQREIDDDAILIQQITENALRTDLKPTEKANAYQDLMQRKGWDAKQLSAGVKLDLSSVYRFLALLKLPKELQREVDAGVLSIKDAIAKGKAGAAPKRKSKPKVTRERKIVVDGYTITVRSRRILTDERIREALQMAEKMLEGVTDKKAA